MGPFEATSTACRRGMSERPLPSNQFPECLI